MGVVLRNYERTINTLQLLDPEYSAEIRRAVGARGNRNPNRRALRNERTGKHRHKPD